MRYIRKYAATGILCLCICVLVPQRVAAQEYLDEILEAEANMPGLAALEAEAAQQIERIRIRVGEEVDFIG